MAKKILLILPFVLIAFSSAWAANSATIPVSCTIPSIPGVNAPAAKPESLIRGGGNADALNNITAAAQKEEFIEKEEQKETLNAEGEKITQRTKTVYIR